MSNNKQITESRAAVAEFEIPFVSYVRECNLEESVDEFDAFTDLYLNESSNRKVK